MVLWVVPARVSGQTISKDPSALAKDLDPQQARRNFGLQSEFDGDMWRLRDESSYP